MKKVLDVFDVSEIKKKGYVLAGTYEEHNSLMTDEIKRTFGKRVILLVNNKKIELDVLDVEVTNSIINQKNIFCSCWPQREIK